MPRPAIITHPNGLCETLHLTGGAFEAIRKSLRWKGLPITKIEWEEKLPPSPPLTVQEEQFQGQRTDKEATI